MYARAGLVAVVLAAVLLAGCQHAGMTWGDGPRSIAVFDTNHGEFRAELFGDMAPQTVRNFGDLAQDGYFNGTLFHRVVGPVKSPPDGFMNQGGDPNSRDGDPETWGRGGPGYRIPDEFPCNDGSIATQRGGCDDRGGLALTHDEPGLLSMANSGPGTGGSQFFVTVAATPWLDGAHAVFGKVTEGMDVVREINRVPTDADSERPLEDVVIHSVRIEGDLPEVDVQRS